MNIFSQYKLGDLELSNRMVMAPMTRCRAIEGNEAIEKGDADLISFGVLFLANPSGTLQEECTSQSSGRCHILYGRREGLQRLSENWIIPFIYHLSR